MEYLTLNETSMPYPLPPRLSKRVGIKILESEIENNCKESVLSVGPGSQLGKNKVTGLSKSRDFFVWNAEDHQNDCVLLGLVLM